MHLSSSRFAEAYKAALQVQDVTGGWLFYFVETFSQAPSTECAELMALVQHNAGAGIASSRVLPFPPSASNDRCSHTRRASGHRGQLLLRRPYRGDVQEFPLRVRVFRSRTRRLWRAAPPSSMNNNVREHAVL